MRQTAHDLEFCGDRDCRRAWDHFGRRGKPNRGSRWQRNVPVWSLQRETIHKGPFDYSRARKAYRYTIHGGAISGRYGQRKGVQSRAGFWGRKFQQFLNTGRFECYAAIDNLSMRKIRKSTIVTETLSLKFDILRIFSYISVQSVLQ